MRLYVAGPVTGRPNMNRDAFEEARAALEAAGHEAVVPLDVVPADYGWRDAMRECVRHLVECDGVARLPDWRSSRGARVETELALGLGMPVMDAGEWCGARERISAEA